MRKKVFICSPFRGAAAVLGGGAAGVEQAEVLQDKTIIEECLKKEQGRYDTLLEMRMNNEIPKEVFSRKQQEVEKRIAELEQQMMQYRDVKPATDDEREWFKAHPQWSKSNKYAELEARIYI